MDVPQVARPFQLGEPKVNCALQLPEAGPALRVAGEGLGMATASRPLELPVHSIRVEMLHRQLVLEVVEVIMVVEGVGIPYVTQALEVAVLAIWVAARVLYLLRCSLARLPPTPAQSRPRGPPLLAM